MKCYIPVYAGGYFDDSYIYIGEFDSPQAAARYVRDRLDMDPGDVGIFTSDECIWSDADILE